MREAGYLASVYPQVYLDFGLAVPYLSLSGKLMYSSDAKLIPELYYLAAKWGRQILAEVLDEAMANSELTATEAETIAIALSKSLAISPSD